MDCARDRRSRPRTSRPASAAGLRHRPDPGPCGDTVPGALIRANRAKADIIACHATTLTRPTAGGTGPSNGKHGHRCTCMSDAEWPGWTGDSGKPHVPMCLDRQSTACLCLTGLTLRRDQRCNQVFFREIGRSGGIRTPGPLVPNQMRYQAALHSDGCLPNGVVAAWKAANRRARPQQPPQSTGGAIPHRDRSQAAPPDRH